MNKVLLLLLCLSSCAQAPADAKYQRKDWKHWTDSNKNCLNTRAEILKERSLIPVQMNKRGCTVVSGKWQDYYFPEVHLTARKVDIDHLVPLKHAYLTGGGIWNKKMRQAFANDPENLVITNRKYNRIKGAKGIDAWLPLHRTYACKYIQDWLEVKKKYKLKITPQEENTISTSDCSKSIL